MLSKTRIKFIQTLSQKKRRDELGLFVAEGPKIVNEFLSYFECNLLLFTEEWSNSTNAVNKEVGFCEQITIDELKKISFLKTPQQVLGVFKKKKTAYLIQEPKTSLCLALDGIQDPGNLGTIIRIADWFGIKNLFCSLDTVDSFSPKTVQATMGALARINITYLSLPSFIDSLSDKTPIYGTFLNGENIYTQQLEQKGLIVMGNEGNGISKELEKRINKRIYIPNYPKGEETSESLNVAVATAITCAEFRRRNG
ncbi:MAG: RNA methyltransferase [Bacteroidaceae bacterium]